jgi:serine protease AprX
LNEESLVITVDDRLARLPALKFTLDARTITWLKKWTMFVLIAFLLAASVPGRTDHRSAILSTQGVNDRLEPILRELATSHPETQIEVIVQATGPLEPIIQAVEMLGGSVFQELHIINALGVTLSAYAASKLGEMPGVKWVSYNAPMQSASATSVELNYTSWATELAGTNSIVESFRSETIPANSTLWFNAVLKADKVPHEATVTVRRSTIEFIANDKRYVIDVPKGRIEFKHGLNQSTTIFDEENQVWITQVPTNYTNKEIFLTAIPFVVPEDFVNKIERVAWRIGIEATHTNMRLAWKWAAAIYQTSFPALYNEIDVKPVHKKYTPSAYFNSDPAGTPEALKNCGCILTGATGDGGRNYTGSYSRWQTIVPSFNDGTASTFTPSYLDSYNMTEHTGPDGYFGWGSASNQGFTGFKGTFTPGYNISRVEVVLHAYVPKRLTKDITLHFYLGNETKSVVIYKDIFNQVALRQPGQIVVDVSRVLDWKWWQLEDLVLAIDHKALPPTTPIFYDAVGLRVTSIPSKVDDNVQLPQVEEPEAIEVEKLQEVFASVVGATEVWNREDNYLQGQGVVVAVVDSGIAQSRDFGNRKFKDVNFNREYHDGNDKYGHGTFVAGMLAGNGYQSKGAYVGVAPSANVLNVRVSNDQGMSTEADVVAALQWILLNKDVYGIRVVNMSLNSSMAQSYHTSPISIASEILWFGGIVVVVSAGNNSSADLFPPANDPYVITVGATDDRGTVDKNDDIMATFSAYGIDEAGNVKPELVAPGTEIISYLPNNGKLTMGQTHPSHQVDRDHFRMSGTSLAAPIVAGAVVLLLQDEPNLTPDQVKHRLISTADSGWSGYDPDKSGAGYVNIPAAIDSASLAEANDAIMPALPLAQMAMIAYWASANSGDVDWESIDWNSIDWNSVDWNSVDWNSVNWNSVNWNSVNWNSVNWNSTYWDNPMDESVRHRELIEGPSEVPILPDFHTLFIPNVQSE